MISQIARAEAAENSHPISTASRAEFSSVSRPTDRYPFLLGYTSLNWQVDRGKGGLAGEAISNILRSHTKDQM